MKKFYTIAGLMMAGTTLVAEEPSKPVEPVEIVQSQEAKSGREAVSKLRQSYEAGSYQEFLGGLEADYQTLAQNGGIQEFVEMRHLAETNEQLEKLAAEWEAKHQTLIDKRNEALMKACEGHADLAVCGRLESVLNQLTPEQKEALRTLSTLRFKTPDMASSEEEKALIQIDLASEFKSVHLDAQHAVEAIADRNDKQIVIKMDMLKQMQQAAQGFQDDGLKQMVNLAADAYDLWQAQGLDWKEIYALVNTPSNDTEKQVSSILSDYKTQREDLYQKEFLAKVDQ